MSCVAPGCKIGYGSSKPPPGVTKHIFPKDPERLEAWIRAVPRDNWRPAKNAVICSLHFESRDFKTESSRGDIEMRRRRLTEQAVPSKFAVKDFERCCVSNCNNISNTFAFPRLKKKDWTEVMRKYFNDPKWESQYWTRICSVHFRNGDVIKTPNRPDRLDPRANPIIDAKKYPPEKQESVKPVPEPKKPMPALVPILTRPTKSVIVRHDLSNAKTFLLERVVKTEALSPEPTTSKEKKVDQYTHPYQQQQFLLQKQQQELEKQHQLLNETHIESPEQLELRQLRPDAVSTISSTKRFPHTLLMRAKGNPNVFVQIDAQLWTPTAGKMPNLPPPPKPVKDPAETLAKKALGTMKDRKIRKLSNKVDRLQKNNAKLKSKLEDMANTLASIFEPDQMNFLASKCDVKRPKHWSEKTFAKAFDLRLNCGNQAYNYLLLKGYPLPSFKAMRRYILSVESKLAESAEADSVQKIEPELQQHSEVIYQSVDMHQQYVPQSVVIETTSKDESQNEAGVYHVQQTMPMVVATGDSVDISYNHHHVIDGNEIHYQTADGQIVDPRQQQLYVIHPGNQVVVLQGGEGRIQNSQILREQVMPNNQTPHTGNKRKTNNQDQSTSKKKRISNDKEQEGPIWYLKLSEAVRQKILFPSISEQSEETQNQILQSDSDDESDSEEENSKSETQDAVSSISVRVVDEDNMTVQVMNVNI